MSTENDGRFKLSMDEDAPDNDLIRSEIDELRIEKLNHRVTFITILIPCIVIVLVVVAYLDIKRRVVTTQTTGTIGVESLSRDLESRFSSLSLRQAKLEENFAQNTESDSVNSAQLSVRLKKMDGAIEGLKKSMLTKKELENRLKKLNTALAAVEKDAKAISSKIAPLEAKLGKELDTLTADLGETRRLVEDLHEKLAENATKTIGKTELDLAVKLESLRLQEILTKRSGATDARISALEKRIDKALKEVKTTTIPPHPPLPPRHPVVQQKRKQKQAPHRTEGWRSRIFSEYEVKDSVPNNIYGTKKTIRINL